MCMFLSLSVHLFSITLFFLHEITTFYGTCYCKIIKIVAIKEHVIVKLKFMFYILLSNLYVNSWYNRGRFKYIIHLWSIPMKSIFIHYSSEIDFTIILLNMIN